MNSIRFFAVLVVVSVAAGKELAGVDPNTLSCDTAGEIFLLLPHFAECGKYYMCVHGKEVEFTCPGDTIFDFEAQACNWNWDTKCWLRPDEIDGSGDEPSILDDLDIPAADIVTGILRPVEVPHGIVDAILNCHTLQSASKQVAYRGDCQRYWRCENGMPQSVYCSDGLYFNPTSRQCDYEANVKCHVPQEDELQGEFIEYK